MRPLLGIYIAVALVAVSGGLGTVLARSVVYASLSLLLTLLAVAGIYVILFSPFLALVQVLIYGGAIIVVVLFALMLTRQTGAMEDLNNRQRPLAGAAALGALGVLIATIFVNVWPQSVDRQQVGFRELGSILFSQWAVPFEIASLLLLVALIGAVVIARPGERK